MSIHGSSPSSLGSFEVCSALKELENGTGIIRINSEDILDKIPNPTEWFLSWCRNIGTPVSQSAEGELALSVRNESYGKKTLEHVAQTQIVNSHFTQTVVM